MQFVSLQLTRLNQIVQYLIYLQKYPRKMDLEWLLPEQIEQILRFCDLSHIQDPSLAANLLEQHHWNLQVALNDVVTQNDQTSHHNKPAKAQVPTAKPYSNPQQYQKYQHLDNQSQFEVGEQHYSQLGLPQPANSHTQHRTILTQQNKEYEQMEKSYIAKLAEEEEWNQYLKLKDQQFSQHKEEFAQHIIQTPIQIKFRLLNKVHIYTFDITDKVEKVFKYVSGHLREDFENKYCEFDLTQNFPFISLKQKYGQTLQEVFDDSTGEVLIVKEL